MRANLEVYQASELVFSSNGHWLHPLFELEDFLSESSLDAGSLSLRDKLIGRGAAVLICRMGIRESHGRTVSRLALDVFENYGFECGWDSLVDTLACQTETILTKDMSPDDAYAELARRAGRI